MEREVIKRDNCNISYIKTEKFKSCQIEIYFKQKFTQEDVTTNSLLADFLTYSTFNYSTNRELLKENEYLYGSYVTGLIFKNGDNLFHRYYVDFLDPKYCDEGHLENVVKLLGDIIFNPNFNNGDKTRKAFDICKNNYRNYLLSEKERPVFYATKQARAIFGKGTSTGVSIYGNLEDLEKITIKDLEKSYKKLINNTECYIYILGNMEKEEVMTYIDRYLNKLNNCPNYNDLFINNKIRKEPLYREEIGPFKQDALIIYYNLNLKSKKEKFITSKIFNYIFGSGGLTSKLYDKVREKNSLCYSIHSLLSPFDNSIHIEAGINKKDKELCLKLIDDCLEEMIKGNFSEEDIEAAITSYKIFWKDIDNKIDSIIWYYYNIDLCEGLEAKECLKIMESVTKEDIIKIAKKVKKNVVYLLCGDEKNEEN